MPPFTTYSYSDHSDSNEPTEFEVWEDGDVIINDLEGDIAAFTTTALRQLLTDRPDLLPLDVQRDLEKLRHPAFQSRLEPGRHEAQVIAVDEDRNLITFMINDIFDRTTKVKIADGPPEPEPEPEPPVAEEFADWIDLDRHIEMILEQNGQLKQQLADAQQELDHRFDLDPLIQEIEAWRAENLDFRQAHIEGTADEPSIARALMADERRAAIDKVLRLIADLKEGKLRPW